MANERPLILLTNDDGIASPGLYAAAAAFAELGDILVVAPREQQSGMGRSMPAIMEGRLYPYEMQIDGAAVAAYAADATPAQAVLHGVLELAERQPSLVVSGINYGENTGNGVTISGTVGAAIEAAALEIPALALSLEMPMDLHLTYSDDVDFATAAYFARRFGAWLLSEERPPDVDLLKVDVPWAATRTTEWRITRQSRKRIFKPTRPQRAAFSDIGRVGYAYDPGLSGVETDSDAHAILTDKIVSVTPMSLDLTSRVNLANLQRMIEQSNHD